MSKEQTSEPKNHEALNIGGVSSILKRTIMTEIFNVKDKLPDVECGSYLVYAPHSFPKNSRWLVAEYYDDVKGFYSESSENFLEDVTHWCELPKEPESK